METSTRTPTWTIGDRLRKAREWSNIESREMAEMLGVSRNTVSNYEHDRTEPTLTALRRWSEVTGVPVDWLLDMQGDAESRSRCILDPPDQLTLPIDPVDGLSYVPAVWAAA